MERKQTGIEDSAKPFKYRMWFSLIYVDLYFFIMYYFFYLDYAFPHPSIYHICMFIKHNYYHLFIITDVNDNTIIL